MPYQPLVTHYCKKFHEAALRATSLAHAYEFAAFDNMITVTMRIRHRNEYHGTLLSRMGGAWHIFRCKYGSETLPEN
jgi:hypothetical protein